MIRLLTNLPDDVIGVEATGTVTAEDYEQVLVPAVQEKRRSHERIRLVYVLGEDFEGWTAGAMWDDAKLGLERPGSWERIAVVSDRDWVRHAVKAFGWMVPGDVRLFALDEREEAERWAAA